MKTTYNKSRVIKRAFSMIDALKGKYSFDYRATLGICMHCAWEEEKALARAESTDIIKSMEELAYAKRALSSASHACYNLILNAYIDADDYTKPIIMEYRNTANAKYRACESAFSACMEAATKGIAVIASMIGAQIEALAEDPGQCCLRLQAKHNRPCHNLPSHRRFR